MFKRKNRVKTVYRLTLLSSAGDAVLCVPLQEMPIPEDCILEMSMEYFRDPEPCEIHRGAVRLRAVAELQSVCPVGMDVPFSRLTEFQQRCFAAYPVHAVRIDEVQET